jgi:hypothetical protein
MSVAMMPFRICTWVPLCHCTLPSGHMLSSCAPLLNPCKAGTSSELLRHAPPRLEPSLRSVRSMESRVVRCVAGPDHEKSPNLNLATWPLGSESGEYYICQSFNNVHIWPWVSLVFPHESIINLILNGVASGIERLVISITSFFFSTSSLCNLLG